MTINWKSVWILKDDLRTWVSGNDAYDFMHASCPDLVRRQYKKGTVILWYEKKEVMEDTDVMRLLERALPKRVSLRDVPAKNPVKKGGAIRGGATTINRPAPPYEKVQFAGFKVKPDTKIGHWTVTKEGFPLITSKIDHGFKHATAGWVLALQSPSVPFTIGDTVLLKDPVPGAVDFKLKVTGVWPTALGFGDPVTTAPFDDASVVGGASPKQAGYKGHDAPRTDMDDRALFMKNAIKAAHAIADKSAKILKIFMAPEFYWRNTGGAYPLEVIPDILTRMSEETRKEDYKDWLFVLGTAIGYIAHEETAGETRKYVFAATHVAGTQMTVTRTGREAKAPTEYPKAETNVIVSLWERIPDGTAYPWKIYQGTASAEVTKVTRATKGTVTVDFKVTSGAFVVDKVVLEEPIAAELINVALVQKGGSDLEGRGGLREAIVYKELASHIDFVNNKPDDWYDISGKHRKILLEDKQQVMLPTEGAVDILSQRRQASNRGDSGTKVSEINVSGYGGGSVLTIDGITFGVEVCRDHLLKRLYTFYNGIPGANPSVARVASKTDPRVQIQLIPSWGAYIDRSAICCVENGLIFNVDGADTLTAARIYDAPNTFTCEKHPTVTSPLRDACSTCQREKKYCSVCGQWPAAKCTCTPKRVPNASWPDIYFCAACDELRGKPVGIAVCPTCAATIAPYYLRVRMSRFGSKIPTTQTDGAVDPGGKKWEDYFEAPGMIDVYVPKAIPPAQKVG